MNSAPGSLTQPDQLGTIDHLQASSSDLHSAHFRFPNLSAYGSEHPADKALGYAQLAGQLHARTAGTAVSASDSLHYAAAINNTREEE